MIRKLVQHGPTTLITSLPSKWVKKYNLKKGDEIEMVEEGNKLILSASKQEELNSTTIDLHKTKFLKRFITIIYNLGYDELVVTYSDSTVIKEIKSALDNLLGFEIVDQAKNSVTIRAISKASEDVAVVLRRTFHITLAMARDSLGPIKKQVYKELSDIAQLEEMQNKFCNFLHRMINKRGYKDDLLSSYIQFIIGQLEQIADEYRDLLLHIAKKQLKLSEELYEMLQKTADYFDALVRQFYKMDLADQPKLKDQRNGLFDELDTLLAQLNHSELTIAINLGAILRLLKHIETTMMYRWEN